MKYFLSLILLFLSLSISAETILINEKSIDYFGRIEVDTSSENATVEIKNTAQTYIVKNNSSVLNTILMSKALNMRLISLSLSDTEIHGLTIE